MPELVPIAKRVANVRTMLEKLKPQIALALPKHLTPDRMLRVAMTSVQRTPRLAECTDISLAGAIIQASQLGLEPDGMLGQAYLIPYKNNRKGGVYEAQFQPGYRGLLDLARRSGEISSVDTRVVYERDTFQYSFGLVPILQHVPTRLPEAERGDIAFVYAIVRLKDGGAQWDVMTTEDVEAHRKQYSRAADDGPWVTAWPEMAKKTVLKRVLKLCPASIELRKALALDDHAEAGLPQDLGADLTGSAVGGPATPGGNGGGKLDQLAKELKGESKPDAVHDAETGDILEPSDLGDDRDAMLVKIGEASAKLDQSTFAALWKKHCGEATRENVDPAALSDLLGEMTKK